MDVDSKKRERDIYRVTIYGSAVNTVLLVLSLLQVSSAGRQP